MHAVGGRRRAQGALLYPMPLLAVVRLCLADCEESPSGHCRGSRSQAGRPLCTCRATGAGSGYQSLIWRPTACRALRDRHDHSHLVPRWSPSCSKNGRDGGIRTRDPLPPGTDKMSGQVRESMEGSRSPAGTSVVVRCRPGESAGIGSPNWLPSNRDLAPFESGTGWVPMVRCGS
jgi:hypothetical protein